jgi:RNA polymerase primary sigma factor
MAYVNDGLRSRSDSFTAYMARVGDSPLLTYAAERELARRIENAERAVARALFRCPASRDVLVEIAEDLAAGRIKAREVTRRPMSLNDGDDEQSWLSVFAELVRSLDVVGGSTPAPAAGVDRLDRALQALRPTRALLDRFSTYATWWIRQALTRSVANTAQMIRLPVHVLDAGRLIAKTRVRLEHAMASNASVEELAEASGMSAEKVGALLHARQEPESLEAPAGVDGDAALGDKIEDERAENPLERIAAARRGLRRSPSVSRCRRDGRRATASRSWHGSHCARARVLKARHR